MATAPFARAVNTQKSVLTTAVALDLGTSYSSGTLPGTTSDLTFTSSTYASTTLTLNLFNLSIGTLNDLDATQALTISASKNLTLNGGGNTVSGTAADLLYVATGGNLTFSGTGGLVLATSGNFNVAGTATISSGISGGFAITKTGAGTLTLGSANTYSGGTNINAGTVNIGNAAALGTAGAISFGGGTLQYGTGITADLSARLGTVGQSYNVDTNGNNVTFGTAFGGTGSNGNTLAKSGAGLLTLNAANTYTGGTTVSAGAVYLGNAAAAGTGTITLAGTSALVYSNQNFNNPLNVTGTATVVNTADNLDGNHTGALTGAGTLTVAQSITVNGTTFTGASSFKYNGDISGFTGTFVDNTASNVIFQGAANNGSNARWAINGNSGAAFVGSRAGTGGIFQMGELSGTSGSAIIYGDYNSGATITYQIGALNTNSTYAGQFRDNTTGLVALKKVGTGTLTLSGGSNYTAGTTITGGALATDQASGLGSGTVSVGTGAALNLTNAGGVNYNFGTLSGAGTINVTTGGGANTTTFNNNVQTAGYSTGFTGTLNVGAGNTTGKLGLNNPLAASATINVLTNSTLALTTAQTFPSAVTLAGGTTGEALGQLRVEGGAVQSGNVTLSGNSTIGANSGTGTISGNVGDGGGARTLQKLGAGTNILTGTNTYTGTTTISGGVLQLGAGGAIGTLATGSAIVNNATLTVNRSNPVVQGTDFSGAAITGSGAFIQAGAGTTTLTAANTFAGTATISAGTLQLGNGGATGSLSATSTITNNGNLTINRSNPVAQGTDFGSGAISGSGSLTQAGTGTTTLSGTNTYAGVTTINAGTLRLGSATALPANTLQGGTNLLLNTGATLDLNANSVSMTVLPGFTGSAGTITSSSGTPTLTVSASDGTQVNQLLTGTLGLTLIRQNGSGGDTQFNNAANTFSGGLTVRGVNGSNVTGTISTGSLNAAGGLTDATLNGVSGYYSGALFGSGTITLDNGQFHTYSGSPTNNLAVTANGGVLHTDASASYSGTISGTGLLFLSNGFTSSSAFSGSMSGFTGTLAVDTNNVGSVNLSGSATGNAAANLVFSGNGSAGTLRWNGAATPTTVAFAELINGVNGGSATAGRLESGVATTVTYQIGDSTANTPSFGGVIQNGNGTVALTKIGTDTQTLAGANTFTGATTINGGTLRAGVASVANTSGAFGNNSAVTLANAASTTLDLNGFNTQVGSLAGGGTTGGNVTLGAGTLTTGGNNASTTFAGAITGTGGLTKTGTGTQTLTGTNAFTGATLVTAGTLAAGGAGALGSGTTGTASITVNNGGTLLLSGAGSLDRIKNSAPIALGGGTGTSTLAVSSAGSGANAVLEGAAAHRVNGAIVGLPTATTAGLGALTLAANATLDFGSASGRATLVLAGFTPGAFTLNVLNYQSTQFLNVTGVSSGTDGIDDRLVFNADQAANLSHFSFNGVAAQEIALDNGYFEVVPVPEPGTVAAGLLALGALGVGQRRRVSRFLAKRRAA